LSESFKPLICGVANLALLEVFYGEAGRGGWVPGGESFDFHVAGRGIDAATVEAEVVGVVVVGGMGSGAELFRYVSIPHLDSSLIVHALYHVCKHISDI